MIRLKISPGIILLLTDCLMGIEMESEEFCGDEDSSRVSAEVGVSSFSWTGVDFSLKKRGFRRGLLRFSAFDEEKKENALVKSCDAVRASRLVLRVPAIPSRTASSIGSNNSREGSCSLFGARSGKLSRS